MHSGNDIQTKSPKQTKLTINGKKKCEEHAMDIVKDDSPQLPKRLVRAFPRYKVIDGEITKGTERTMAKNARTNAINKVTEANAAKEDLVECEKGIKDPETGLIVKFKRVRESELSKLTFEADNFMFPKREEQPTDEDRQSTSEPDADASSELLSSEVSGLRDSFSTPNNSSLNVSTTTTTSTAATAAAATTTGDQFTSSGRRKKRRNQYDTFKSPATNKQKFRASLIQSRLNSNKITPTANGSQALVKQQRQSAKLSVAKIRAATGRKNKRQRKTATVAVDAQPDSSLDDRMGEISYMGGKLLATDYIQNLKFSFERVPSNEPWYLTFQRQDEHRERMFEYWGNTGKKSMAITIPVAMTLCQKMILMHSLFVHSIPKASI